MEDIVLNDYNVKLFSVSSIIVTVCYLYLIKVWKRFTHRKVLLLIQQTMAASWNQRTQIIAMRGLLVSPLNVFLANLISIFRHLWEVGKNTVITKATRWIKQTHMIKQYMQTRKRVFEATAHHSKQRDKACRLFTLNVISCQSSEDSCAEITQSCFLLAEAQGWRRCFAFSWRAWQ